MVKVNQGIVDLNVVVKGLRQIPQKLVVIKGLIAWKPAGRDDDDFVSCCVVTDDLNDSSTGDIREVLLFPNSDTMANTGTASSASQTQSRVEGVFGHIPGESSLKVLLYRSISQRRTKEGWSRLLLALNQFVIFVLWLIIFRVLGLKQVRIIEF